MASSPGSLRMTSSFSRDDSDATFQSHLDHISSPLSLARRNSQMTTPVTPLRQKVGLEIKRNVNGEGQSLSPDFWAAVDAKNKGLNTWVGDMESFPG